MSSADSRRRSCAGRWLTCSRCRRHCRARQRPRRALGDLDIIGVERIAIIDADVAHPVDRMSSRDEKPRTEKASPPPGIEPSPAWRLIPATLRSASRSVRWPCSSSSSSSKSCVTVCGVSSSGSADWGVKAPPRRPVAAHHDDRHRHRRPVPARAALARVAAERRLRQTTAVRAQRGAEPAGTPATRRECSLKSPATFTGRRASGSALGTMRYGKAAPAAFRHLSDRQTSLTRRFPRRSVSGSEERR